MKTVVSTLIAFLVVAVSLHAASDFQLQVINNIADPAAGNLTIQINGKDFRKNLGFREASPLTTVKLPATLSIVAANPAYAIDIENGREFTLEQYDGGVVILTLHGVADPANFSTPDQSRDINFMIHEFALLPDAIQPSKVAVTVLHSATDLPKLDLRVLNDNPLVTDMDYGQTSFFTASLPTKSYTLSLHPQGDMATTWKNVVADFSQDAGKHVYIMPSGFLDPAANQNGPDLELIAVYADGNVVILPPPGEMKTGKLQLVHASADPVAESVDVYVNGTKVADNMGFRSASPFVDIPAEEALSIVVAEPNSNSFDDKVLTTFIADPVPENSYTTMILTGVVSATGFAPNPGGAPITMSLSMLADPHMKSPVSSEVDVIPVHAVTDINAVDALYRGGMKFATSLSYRNAGSYLHVAPEQYIVDITPPGMNDLLVKSFTADFSSLAGESIILVAAGFADPASNKDGSGVTLFTVSTNGTVTVLEEIAVGVQEELALRSSLSVAPNPATETVFVSCELPTGAPVVLSVHDVAGRVVKTIDKGTMPAGRISVPVATDDLAPGVYMLTLEAGGHRISRSLTVAR